MLSFLHTFYRHQSVSLGVKRTFAFRPTNNLKASVLTLPEVMRVAQADRQVRLVAPFDRARMF